MDKIEDIFHNNIDDREDAESNKPSTINFLLNSEGGPLKMATSNGMMLLENHHSNNNDTTNSNSPITSPSSSSSTSTFPKIEDTGERKGKLSEAGQEYINDRGQLIGKSGKPLRNTKRAAQNRNSQKHFRERRGKYIKDLEEKVDVLGKLEQENRMLKQENMLLRRQLDLNRTVQQDVSPRPSNYTTEFFPNSNDPHMPNIDNPDPS